MATEGYQARMVSQGKATKGNRMKCKVNPMAGMTAAEKNAYLLHKATAFKKLHSHNFTTAPTPSKPIPVASSRFATV